MKRNVVKLFLMLCLTLASWGASASVVVIPRHVVVVPQTRVVVVHPVYCRGNVCYHHYQYRYSNGNYYRYYY